MHAQNHDGLTITVEEAARRLGIGRSLAYDLARRGELPGLIRLGRTYRVSRPALDRALGVESATEAASEPPASL